MIDIKKRTMERLSAYSPDCGDNSCRFATNKTGMRTNGGCRCMSTRSVLGAPTFEKLAAVQIQIIRELLDEIESLTKGNGSPTSTEKK